MHQSLKALLHLQEIDSRIIFLRGAREKRPRELEGDKRRLDEKNRMAEGITQEIKRVRMESDRRELDLRKNEAEVVKLRTALNLARSNQEYQILKEQIARLETEDGKIEEDVLKRLGDVDGLDRARKDAEGEIKGLRVDYQRKVDEMTLTLKGIDEQLRELEARRGAASSEVPGEHLQLYQRVLNRHRDFALARVENQVCQGCFMSVTPQTMNLLLQDRELSQCRNCLRILYLD